MEAENMSRRERKKIETRESILKAARHLFEDKGYEETSIDEITEKADVSKGTFFNYFPSKDSLLTAIAEEEIEDIAFFIEEELKDTVGSVKKIKLVMKRLLEDAIPYLYLTGRIIFSSIINTGDNPSPVVRLNHILETLVKEGQDNGEIDAGFASEDIVTSIMGGYYGIIFKWFEYGRIPGTSSEIDRLMDILLQGIKGAFYRG